MFVNGQRLEVFIDKLLAEQPFEKEVRPNDNPYFIVEFPTSGGQAWGNAIGIYGHRYSTRKYLLYRKMSSKKFTMDIPPEQWAYGHSWNIVGICKGAFPQNKLIIRVRGW